MPDFCKNGICKNLQGSFKCDCNTGFVLTRSGTCQGLKFIL
jgi:hypothetical protein